MKLFITTAEYLSKGCKLKEQKLSTTDHVTIMYNNKDSALSMETVNYFLSGEFDKEFIETTNENLNIIAAFYIGEAIASKKYSDITVMAVKDEFLAIEELMKKNNINFSIIKNAVLDMDQNKQQKTPGKRGRKPGSTKKINNNLEKDMVAAVAV